MVSAGRSIRGVEEQGAACDTGAAARQRGQMTIPSVSPQQIAKVMDQFDQELRPGPLWTTWENNQAHRYAIEREGKLYQVKQIILMATGAPASTFGGGNEANKYLQDRGFEIIPLRGADQSGVFLLQGEDSLLPMQPAS